jgi:capsule polysaccharide export protein KpsE/RkpR
MDGAFPPSSYTPDRNDAVDSPRGQSASVDLTTGLAAVLEHWKAVAGFVAAVAVIIATVLAFQRKEYEAKMTLSVISKNVLIPGAGIAASLLAAGNAGGLQATPPLIDELAHLDGVMRHVADSPLTPGGKESVLDRLVKIEGIDSIPQYLIPDAMRDMIETSIQHETGTITLRVTQRDSGMARIVAQHLVDQVSDAFVSATRAQASQLRRAEDARVDTAARALATQEQRMVDFLQANRTIASFSLAALEQQRIQRAIQIAQDAYMQAVTDREAARGKELEETPAIVVLDPLPRALAPVPRHRVLKFAVSIVIAFLAVVFVIVFRETRRSRFVAVDGDERLRAAVARVPILRRLLRDTIAA